MNNFVSSKEYWQDIHRLSAKLKDPIKKLIRTGARRPVIITLYKGGLIPATVISYQFSLELYIYGKGMIFPAITEEDGTAAPIIIIDDLVDTGTQTLAFIRELITSGSKPENITVAVLYNKRVKDKYLEPTIFVKEKGPEYLNFFYDQH